MKAIREYLKHKQCLRGRILDRGELKRVAHACDLSPQEARTELKKLGFILTKNNHGLMIWKKQDNNPLEYNIRILRLNRMSITEMDAWAEYCSSRGKI